MGACLEIDRIERDVLCPGLVDDAGVPCIRRATHLPMTRAPQTRVRITDHGSFVEALRLELGLRPAALEEDHRGVATDEFASQGEPRRACTNDADVCLELSPTRQEARILRHGVAPLSEVTAGVRRNDRDVPATSHFGNNADTRAP